MSGTVDKWFKHYSATNVKDTNSLRRVEFVAGNGEHVDAKLIHVGRDFSHCLCGVGVHEYSAIEGVQEDVMEIMLNLKGVALQMHNRDELEVKKKK